MRGWRVRSSGRVAERRRPGRPTTRTTDDPDDRRPGRRLILTAADPDGGQRVIRTADGG
jgi:hypothetical protein